MSEIVQLYKDSSKTEKVYPKTLANATYMEDGKTTISEQLADISKHAKGKTNIASYVDLVIGEDWTNAINKAIEDCLIGGTIIFHEGIFKHTGFNIPRYINIEGCGRFGSKLVNISINDAITILPSAERGSFRNIAILGNGTLIYGTDATSGNGIVFSNNSIAWNFENITVRGHGKNGFKGGHLGHVNNINIINSDIEFNKEDAININASVNGQVNALNISGNNIANNGGNGISTWGSSITIKSNSVQGNQKRAYDINADNTIGGASGYCEKITIENNYSELNKLGLAYIKSTKVGSVYKSARGITFRSNFGVEDAITTGSLILCESVGIQWYEKHLMTEIHYDDNKIKSNISNISIINGNSLLSDTSVVSVQKKNSQFINMGLANIKYRQRNRVFNNYLECRNSNSVTFDINGRSSNILSETYLYYPVNIDNFKGATRFEMLINTDKPTRIDFNILGRLKCVSDNFTKLNTYSIPTATNGINTSGDITSIFDYASYDEIMLEIKIYSVGVGTFLNIYNPNMILY